MPAFIFAGMKHPTESAYSIRLFDADEATAYKAMRLEALLSEPGMFGNSFEKESDFPEAHRSGMLTNPDRGCFGLFYNEELIGITSLIRNKDLRQQAYLTQSYIRKAHRGKGLSRMLYDARLGWARANGLQSLIIGHRESNLASKKANQHYGFRFTHREPRLWPDGIQEDMLYYTLDL